MKYRFLYDQKRQHEMGWDMIWNGWPLDWDDNIVKFYLISFILIVIFTINIFIFRINIYDLLNLRAQKYL